VKARSENGSDSPASGDALSLEAIGRSVVAKPADTKMIADYHKALSKQFRDARRASSKQARQVVARASSIVERIHPASKDAGNRLAELKEDMAFRERLLNADDVELKAEIAILLSKIPAPRHAS